jgi:hypothetical protein
LEEELIGGVVVLDLLFQIPQKYARIIGGKREGASSRGSTMDVGEKLKNTLETLENHWGRSPFYSKSKYGYWGQNSGEFRSKVGLTGLCAEPPGAQLGERRAYARKPPRYGFR